MLGLFDLMQSDQITITGDNGTKVTLSKLGALITLTVISDRRIFNDEMRGVFPIPDDTPEATLLDIGPQKRSRTSFPA